MENDTIEWVIGYDMSELYEARHVRQFLGIDKNQLFHWTQTKKLMRPILLGEGRGGRTKFSIDDLLTLSLIKKINDFGIELNTLKKIMACLENAKFLTYDSQKKLKTAQFKGTIWDYYRIYRDLFRKHGYSLEISRGPTSGSINALTRLKFISEERAKRMKAQQFSARAMDGESQTELLSASINRPEKRDEETDEDVWMLGYQSKDIVIIISLMALISYVEEKTKRAV